MAEGNNNLNGPAVKLIGVAMLVIGIVAGVHNMGAPDRQRIKDNKAGVDRALADVRAYLIKTEHVSADIGFIKKQLQEMHVKVDKGEQDHAFSLAKTAAVEVQFKEVETQFGNLDERTADMRGRSTRIEERLLGELAVLDKRLQDEIKVAKVGVSLDEDIQPRLRVLEEYLKWINEKLELVAP